MIELTWLGQMGLKIKTEETTLYIDYYATPDPERRTPPPIPTESLKDADLILGTHDHLDHIDHEAWKVWAKNMPEAKFVFPRAHFSAVLKDGVNKENAVGLNENESYTYKNVTVHAIAAAHEFLEKDEDTGLYPYLQYIIEVDGVRIHHGGDTVRYEGMLGKIKSFGHIDVELIPINGRDARRYKNDCIGNMTYQEAADLAGEVKPGLVIPGHFDMFSFNSADPKDFADYIAVKYKGDLKCHIPTVMENITV